MGRYLATLPLTWRGTTFYDVPAEEAVIYYGRASGQLGLAAAGWLDATFLEPPAGPGGYLFTTYDLQGVSGPSDRPYVGRILALGHGVRCAIADADLAAFVHVRCSVERLTESGESAGLEEVHITGHQWGAGNPPSLQGVQAGVLAGDWTESLLPLGNPIEHFPARHFRLRARYEHVAGGTLAIDTLVEFACAVAIFPQPSED